jgi:hypothetical protein
VLKVLQIDTLQDWQFHCPGLLRIPRFSHCCPNLQQLQFGAPLSTCVDLTPMMQLQQLTELLLLTLLDKSMAASLASLTGLKKLTLHTWQLPDEALLQLTALTGLEELLITAGRSNTGFEGMSQGLREALHGDLLLAAEQRTRLRLQHNAVSVRWWQRYKCCIL